jgi:hypothetical protein
MVRSLWRIRLDNWAVVGVWERHTGAVVDLVVDDHVKVFLWELLVPRRLV